MMFLENAVGIKRTKVHKPVNYPYTQKLGQTAYQRQFREVKKGQHKGEIHNVEIDANHIITNVRLKNNYSINEVTYN